jgi:hypothetical protein
MSELTPCNYCSLLAIKNAYGKNNIRLVADQEEMIGWIAVELKQEGRPWTSIAWFMQLTAHCVC